MVSQSVILNRNKHNEKKTNKRLAVNLLEVIIVQQPLTWSPVGPYPSSPLICIHICQSPQCLIHLPSSLP